MDPLRELLATDQKQTLEFFMLRLQEVSEPNVDRRELMYNASVLAHYSQVSTTSETDWPTPATLSDVYDHFVADFFVLKDAQLMESAASQCLLLAGFFEDQMQARHNIHWYAKLGAAFFRRAGHLEKSREKTRLLYNLSKGFEDWRQRQARLAHELRDSPYLIRPS